MGVRSTNKCDGSAQDIAEVVTELRRLFLSYRDGDVLYIYLLNVFELLLQSARTRICLLRKPQKTVAKYTPAIIQEMLILDTFRNDECIKEFHHKLATQLETEGFNWLEKETLKLKISDNRFFYIHLVRSYPEHKDLRLDFQSNARAYQRLGRLLKSLQKNHASLLEKIYHCFDKITTNYTKNIQTNNEIDINNVSAPHFNERLLKPIIDWVDDVYFEYRNIPLVQTQYHSTPINIDYSNLFFFIRINSEPLPADNATHIPNKFAVKLVCPQTQRQELSRFFHTYREFGCQWFQQGEQCSIRGMGNCLFSEVWKDLSIHATDQTTLDQYYGEFWEEMSAPTSCSERVLASAAFRSSSIVFERRVKQTLDDDDYPMTRSEKLFTCVKCRLLPPATKDASNLEDQVPQMMFVPIYSAATPLMLVATVVNAHLPKALSDSLREWQRSFRFAEMVHRFIASRFKERARKAYLGLAADCIQQGYENCKKHNAASATHCAACFLEGVNRQLDILSKIYPYHRLSLQKTKNPVIKEERHDGIEVPGCGYFVVERVTNPYWRHYSNRDFFTNEDVVRKLRTAVKRVIATESEEQRKRVRFQMWFNARHGCFPPPVKDDWQEMAKEMGWDGD